MTSTEGPPHLLSLKVMRVSRPALASSWEPFYSSSPSFSARSTALLVSLQTKEALPGHPKTLRDFNLGEILMLPAAFGAIQLGETFSSCIAVNNDTAVDIEGVTLRIEMQSTTTKLVLAEFGGPNSTLAPGDTMENVVHHEIKELGQHVLACSVFYRLPPGARPHPSSSESQDPSIQSFRKFYKFQVTNPLSVKTKVHLPRSPSAMLSVAEREKVFLEVHIQNLTQDAMWLQRMHFESTDGWQVVDANGGNVAGKDPGESLFSGAMALMQPQDMRQYIYILTPSIIPPFPATHTPGAVIPLGRLDISWRSSFGEPGRLLTSMLSRRIPLVQPMAVPAPPPKQAASALPLHLQRSASVASAPSRMQSPHLAQRPMSPPAAPGSPQPYRPGSPFRNRQSTIGVPPRVGSPAPVSPQPPTPTPQKPVPDIEIDLVVRSIPRDDLSIEKPFRVAFTLNVSALVPLAPTGQSRRRRNLTFAIQHVQPPRIRAAVLPKAVTQTQTEPWSPRLPSSGFSTPSPYATPLRADFHDTLARKLLVASPRATSSEIGSDSGFDAEGRESARETPLPGGLRKAPEAITLPPPFAAIADPNAEPRQHSHDVVSQGPSALFLPAMQFSIIDGQVLEHATVAEGWSRCAT
ncbi:hypothetical protein QCA50_002747 [Cerrena zonata]|uniref:DUF974-domain-containing protein n=1 Tax=Cerrena zonata TaxID=2478898 RepID=A0AAW0GUN7_9APHY